MLSEDLRKRIAALNKRSLRHEPPESASGQAEEEVNRSDSAQTSKSTRAAPAVSPPTEELRVVATASDARLRLTLEEVATGVEVENEAGQFLLIDRPFQEVLPGGDLFETRYGKMLDGLDDGDVPADPHGTFDALAEAGAEDVAYVDIEATGLTAGTPLFLVGALSFSKKTLWVRQLLARDYTEEAALLLHFGQMLEASEVVVSFNGKTYDLPYIRDRSIFFGVPFRLRQAHIDLLHVARRRYRSRLPNCKLQTLEKAICRRIRKGDIPGAEIPDAYHRFVRTGNAVQMRDILHHNALDLITMAEVLMFILEGRDL